ncbi:MAG: hypothetical protein RR490_09895 [Niameybacter sp.]
MGRATQTRVVTTKTTKTISSSRGSATPKSAQHPVDCCVHKTHSKKP